MPWERQLTLEQMRVELAPRIAFDDIRNFTPSIVCLDIRPPEEYVINLMVYLVSIIGTDLL